MHRARSRRTQSGRRERTSARHGVEGDRVAEGNTETPSPGRYRVRPLPAGEVGGGRKRGVRQEQYVLHRSRNESRRDGELTMC